MPATRPHQSTRSLLHDLIFGCDDMPRIDVPSLCDRLHDLGLAIEESIVEGYLHEWYMTGMLGFSEGAYVIANQTAATPHVTTTQ